ncbi:MAG: PDZ domain-containing protein [Woeseiaceae bacterium]
MSSAHRYTIRPEDPAAHIFEVTLTVAAPDGDGQVFAMPAWIPGSYMIRDYAKHIVSIRAESDGLDVPLEKLDKSHWRAAPVQRELTLVLHVYAYDRSVRGSHLDTTHAFFNGTCVFPFVVGQEDTECTVLIEPPAEPVGKGWRVATSMQTAGAEHYGYGLYRADSYAELIDHPVEIGELTIGEFEIRGIPHAIAIRGGTRVDMARVCHDLEVVCEQHMKLLGPPKDLDRYLFLLDAPAKGYGGLEHRWSSSLVCARDALPAKQDQDVSDEYRTFLGLASHEYFHLWNVKRMKPAVFEPYDLRSESHTSLLWVFEGITSYYDDLALVRAGLISEQSYLELLGQIITRVLRTHGRHKQSVAESSFDAWTKFYKQDANARNAIISYYAKGAMIALSLDLRLRSDSDGRCSLDDVMRECWARFGETGHGMPEDGFESVCAEVSGLDLSDFFHAAVRGTGELPLEPLLKTHGIDYHLRQMLSSSDKGGKPADLSATAKVWLGASLATVGGVSTVVSVANGGPAEDAGIAPEDEIVALDGLKLTAANADQRLRRYRNADKLELVVFRNDELITTKIRMAEAPLDTCFLSASDADEDTIARRRAWIDG